MSTTRSEIAGYRYASSETNHSHQILLPATLGELAKFFRESTTERRVFDLGCGNGSVAAHLARQGFQVEGVDPSEEGIAAAQRTFPDLRLELGSAYDDLAARFGRFPAVVSLEVVEHVYSPRAYAKTLFDLVEPGGIAIISTPYHGYIKNLVLALSGKMDNHFTALWDHGHIKFWSVRTFTTLLEEAGFRDLSFRMVGRVPALAKSMVVTARKRSGQGAAL